MFGAIAGGIASALAGGAMSKLFGGGQKAASGGIQGDVLATDNNTVGMGDAGIKSAIQGSNVPNPDEAVPSFVSGAMAKAGKDFLKVRCRLALLPFLISCLIWLDLVASLPLIKERILVIILLLHFLSLMLGRDRKSGSAGMPRPISYAVFCLKKKMTINDWYGRKSAIFQFIVYPIESF